MRSKQPTLTVGSLAQLSCIGGLTAVRLDVSQVKPPRLVTLADTEGNRTVGAQELQSHSCDLVL